MILTKADALIFCLLHMVTKFYVLYKIKILSLKILIFIFMMRRGNDIVVQLSNDNSSAAKSINDAMSFRR